MTAADQGWRSARTELTIAGTVVAVTAVAGYAWAGLSAAVIVIAVAGLAALALLRSLPVPYAPPAGPQHEMSYSGGRSVITGFWRRRQMLTEVTSGTGRYDFELRATLQHLLAARLAERHDISLYAEPERARELLASGTHDYLWQWLDPAREAAPDGKNAGIPRRTLAAIIDRLEQL